MADNGEKRHFVVRDGEEETSNFTGAYPRQAALKAARRIATAADTEDDARDQPSELRLRERGTAKLHVYEAWAWEEAAPDNSPDWLGETVTEANVAKQGIEHL
jgi:hypothetical protein